ncbi:MAG: MFS transporter [Planctomycetaceae bacterium]|nr:MFS transporter [Planctomycetaceae bacterium]
MDQLEFRNATFNAIGESLWGLMTAMVSSMTVLVVLLKRLGAGEQMIGAIAAIDGGVLILPQLLGVYLFQPGRRRKRLLVVWHMVAFAPCLALSAVAILLADRMGPQATRWALMGCFALPLLLVGAVVPAWMDWLAWLFPASIRGRVLGAAWAGFALAATAGQLLAGWLIERFPGTDIYGVLYLAAAAISLVSMVFYAMIREPHIEALPSPRMTTREIFARFAGSLKDSNFRAFLIGRILATGGFCMLPLVAVHFSSAGAGRLDSGTVVACGGAMSIAMAVANLVLGRIGDLLGHRLGLITCGAAQVLTLLLLLLPGSIAVCIAAYFWAGVAVGGAIVSHSNMLFETCPHDHRLAHITIANIVLSGPLLAAPLLAGTVAQAYGTRPVFLTCLALSATALAWFIFRVREPRHLEAYQRNLI